MQLTAGRRKTKMQVAPKYRPMTGDKLDYHEFMERYKDILDWLAELYVNTLNIIHYMHDKYAYEAPQLALMDTIYNGHSQLVLPESLMRLIVSWQLNTVK